MNLNELVLKNREFNEWKEKIETEIENRKNEIKDINLNLNLEDIKKLSYDDAKDIFEIIKHNLDYKNVTPAFRDILEELKVNKYPEMKKAHYYPVLNNIDFLSKEEIKKLDEYLFYHQRIIIRDSFYIDLWSDCGIQEDKKELLIEFMHNNQMLRRRFTISCPRCHDGDTDYISDERYYNTKRFFEIQNKLRQNSVVSETDESWFENFDLYREGYCEIPCECEGLEIEEWSDIEDNLSTEYIFIGTADRTYSNL